MHDATTFFQAFALTTIIFIVAVGAPVFGALSCTVTTAAGCSNTVILRMSGSSNAHAELPSQSNSAYANNVICCSGVTGLGNSCSGSFATVLKLSAATNAHVEQNSQSNYANSACISAPTAITVAYQLGNCTGYDTTLGSMSGVTNAHVGDSNAYNTKICGSGSSASLTFTVSNQGFAASSVNVTPGVAIMATSTLSVSTNNVNGWNITLAGDNKSSTSNNLQLAGDTTVQIADQNEWVSGAATSSAGNAVRISSLNNAGNVLAFRVMTASSTNGEAFTAGSWWGSADNYAVDAVNTLYAGISSSTIQRQIGNAGAGSYSATAHLNDVQYYLKIPVTQKTGVYSATVTYTATANP